jgi:4-hydroxy-4-methyl-2-oxoglutarate aldolase
MALTAQKRAEILDTVSKLRVTDVRDGLDWVGYHHFGTVSPDIRPLWRTKAAGFAQTCRHIPTQQVVPTMSPDDYTKWAYEYWYGKIFDNHGFGDRVGPGDFLVVDACNTQTPAVGSMDSMIWAAKGMTGCLTNGGTRDTDEALYQKALPVWSRWIVQPMYQGRVEWGGDSVPVEIGGVLIKPGDLIVADGDGAICVPQDLIDDVLKYAIQESENDKKARKMLFDRLGIAHDHTVESIFDVPAHPYEISPDRFKTLVARNK